jgi:hypothetical protein
MKEDSLLNLKMYFDEAVRPTIEGKTRPLEKQSRY